MRYCKGCGAQLPEDAVFCPSCGRNVQQDFQSNYGGQNNNGYNRNYNTEYCQNGNNYNPNYMYEERYTPMTIVGFVFAFLSSLVGLILSIIAYNDAKRTGSVKNLSMSKAGIIISAVLMGLEVFLSILVFIFVICGIFAFGQIYIAL